MTEPIKHEETRTTAAPHWNLGIGLETVSGIGPEIVSSCSCGARWTHPAGRPAETMDSIFASHVSYFERTTVVL